MLKHPKLPFEVSVQFYDALYADKNYAQEALAIHEQIQKYHPSAKTILDLGCGTGRHSHELTKLGYQVSGIDISPEMIELAKKRNYDTQIPFYVGDVRTIRLNKTFDVVISLFHVASYQTTDDDLKSFLETAKTHLNPQGIFIFDFWCALGLLAEPPQVRVKRVKINDGEITRITEPVHHLESSIVDVYFEYLHLKNDGSHERYHELHRMRYFLPREFDDAMRNPLLRLKNVVKSSSEINRSTFSFTKITKRI